MHNVLSELRTKLILMRRLLDHATGLINLSASWQIALQSMFLLRFKSYVLCACALACVSFFFVDLFNPFLHDFMNNAVRLS